MKTPGISILVVEDEAMTAMFMETMLKRKGYNVMKLVSSGEEAVIFAREFIPDIVIMDIRLAGKMDGIEAVAKIKSESDKSIQCIFTTGYSDPELKDEAMKLNPLAFLIKPINLNELLSLIEALKSEHEKSKEVL